MTEDSQNLANFLGYRQKEEIIINVNEFCYEKYFFFWKSDKPCKKAVKITRTCC